MWGLWEGGRKLREEGSRLGELSTQRKMGSLREDPCLDLLRLCCSNCKQMLKDPGEMCLLLRQICDGPGVLDSNQPMGNTDVASDALRIRL